MDKTKTVTILCILIILMLGVVLFAVRKQLTGKDAETEKEAEEPAE